MRVLIVDDHEAMRTGLRVALESRLGVEVCGEAADGLEGLQKTLELVPDLVILDVTMPNVDGFTAAKEISRYLPSVPILFLSMHDGPSIVNSARTAGVSGFVAKSQPISVLLKAVDAIAHKQTFFPNVAPADPNEEPTVTLKPHARD
jgi:two-component system, NarL family, response regulator NreC